ncbi:pyridoxamine 5'-phosphate oxidase family protein [Streptomyces sp. PKU-EA00015]|uniref:pyridoxamine 5'-phosphate oxidase family protein n=1 Tax=Streptomyces sp. PKU-EA00015 TaxID=2748326 RepID=UPI0015A0156E|nr:pyridoxamine 5'-phosphate oxidase family protein [Streptomyces sp. PKU-EA00015]NWF27636.1 pyridoxamine 5'-phosphate oxidase family protein [Streptomyces sp. PKU-EA00015]
MSVADPVAQLDPRFSDPKAAAASWPEAAARVAAAEVFWLTTVRADGRPHVTPLIAVWHDDALHFCTGPGEQKALNLRTNPHVVLTTGSTNSLSEGDDVVVEGEAVRVTDESALRTLARLWTEKYGEDWTFEVRDGVFAHTAGEALVFRVAPRKAFGFHRGEPYGQTRWSFTG